MITKKNTRNCIKSLCYFKNGTKAYTQKNTAIYWATTKCLYKTCYDSQQFLKVGVIISNSQMQKLKSSLNLIVAQLSCKLWVDFKDHGLSINYSNTNVSNLFIPKCHQLG